MPGKEHLIDGIPVRDLGHAALRWETGRVTRESFQCSDTIAK
jgi:hypothetical protein